MMAASSASWFSLILYSREGDGPNVASQILGFEDSVAPPYVKDF
ncbi:hypothetical protein PGR6_21840 [Pseudomonas sp. GR 6-02]|nr:hypothetical protein PGR6_21840 [Pseudomonas sp. GR 6-02]